MIRLVVANQRGGAGKTTTSINYAWYLAGLRRRTLLIDADTQGSIGVLLALRPPHSLKNFVVDGLPLEECVISAGKDLDILCGGKDSIQVESSLASAPAPELALRESLQSSGGRYEAVVIDASPSISVLQACAMIYAGNVLVPVSMDLLSLTGAAAVCETVRALNQRTAGDTRAIGLLPCQVDNRLSITKLVYNGLANVSERFQVPILPPIRTDQSVQRAWQAHLPILEYSQAAKAAQDYVAAFERVTQMIEASPE